MNSESKISSIMHKTLKDFWGYSAFRFSQEEIINSIISGKDTLALLPTGGGKSLCYQLPAIILEGTCLVISPLLALMKDQLLALEKLGIEAAYLSSELEESEEERIYSNCIEGFTKILYVSPERLKNQNFLRRIQEINISFMAVDEAHCISEWGQDFRPSYQNIRNFRKEFKNVPLLALTATATLKVVDEISLKLELKKANVFKQSFRRNNINIVVENNSDKYEKIKNILLQNKATGIIYTRTRKEAEQLTAYLKGNKINNVEFYHAGLTRSEKLHIQNQWMASSSRVLISTNAFGMGIDKDDVRFVIHFSPSPSIENYYQEIGRAGRDGRESLAYMIYNENELNNLDSISKNQIPTKEEYQRIIIYLFGTCQVAEHELPEKTFTLNVEKIQRLAKVSKSKILNVVNFLHNQELLFYKNTKSLSTITSLVQAQDIDLLPSKDAYFMELLYRNISGFSNYKVHFSELRFCAKNNYALQDFKDRLQQMQKNEYIEYFDGSNHSVKFLKPKDEIRLFGLYYHLFNDIQKNKLKKWEEMKFFIQSKDHCKMKMILRYFGEQNPENCGNCNVCQKKSPAKGKSILSDIVNHLRERPHTLEEMTIRLSFHSKEKILESLIFLLDLGEIKMLNYKTYTINK